MFTFLWINDLFTVYKLYINRHLKMNEESISEEELHKPADQKKTSSTR